MQIVGFPHEAAHISLYQVYFHCCPATQALHEILFYNMVAILLNTRGYIGISLKILFILFDAYVVMHHKSIS